jgi:predicted phosphodiesterase
MRYYFFGDIHGNVHALERCLAHLEEIRADRAYCLGDLVGWLPFGDRSLSRMRQLDIPTVAGNHDLLVAGLFTDHPEQLDRLQASAYNAGLLSSVPQAFEVLLNLPLRLEEADFTVVHHSPFDLPPAGEPPTIDCFNYLDEKALNGVLERWHDYPQRLIFSGHDHLPAVYELSGDQDLQLNVYRPTPREPLTIAVNRQARYWIKAGSVGGPYRDQVAVANSALYDSAAETLTLYRLPYPTEDLDRELGQHRYCSNLKTIQQYRELLRKFNAIKNGAL